MTNDKFPKYILRTDIESFFETIPHRKLKEKIIQNNRLDYYSQNTILSILEQYKKITKQDKGIPRGIGISSYLAEVYMKDFDNLVKSLDGVFYYTRFVDDIVIVSLEDISEKFKEICQYYDLTINTNKNKLLCINEKNQNGQIDYLGYTIKINGDISISKNKEKKIKKKIEITFETYKKESKYNDKRAWKDLCNRLKFLTGNTKLVNVKKNILVGSYFSNYLLNTSNTYNALDIMLLRQIDKLKIYDKIQYRNVNKMKEYLKQFTFKDGFANKIFYNFTPSEIITITRIWKNI